MLELSGTLEWNRAIIHVITGSDTAIFIVVFEHMCEYLGINLTNLRGHTRVCAYTDACAREFTVAHVCVCVYARLVSNT